MYMLNRARLDLSWAPNLTISDVINALIDNRVPPEWVDHSYPHSVITLNRLHTESPIHQGLFDAINNERLAHLHIYGEPPAITLWDGWRHPSESEVAKLHDILAAEDCRPQRRGGELAHFRGFDSPAWLLVGQGRVVEYLTH
jgi:hypothetical protein